MKFWAGMDQLRPRLDELLRRLDRLQPFVDRVQSGNAQDRLAEAQRRADVQFQRLAEAQQRSQESLNALLRHVKELAPRPPGPRE